MADNPHTQTEPNDGGDATTYDLSDPQLQELIKHAVDNANKPVAANNKKLLGQLNTVRELIKEAGGEDAIREWIEARDAEPTDDGKGDGKDPDAKKKEIEGYVNQATAKYQRDLERLNKELEESRDTATSERKLRHQQSIENSLVSAAAELHAEDPALVASMLSGEFSIDEENFGKTPVILDDDGVAVLGSDGRSPKTGKERVAELKEAKPFLFKKSVGMGVQTGGGRRLSPEQYANLSPTEKMTLGRKMKTPQ